MATGRSTVNKVILLGRLGKDPELKYTPSGAAVATFSMATNRVWKDQAGAVQERTDWHRVVAWRKLAEFTNSYLKKGSLIYVEGRLETRSWTDSNNLTRYITEVIAETLQMVGPKMERAGEPVDIPPPAEEMAPVEPEQAPAPSEDDLPF
ncbi:MAG: single-stranded DNA-binding protein [candidate division KSB1 bacterium]|nr:single-stranded DNA-binding protein [candidate division KSB1 bacterium]MDZ7318830.1 single-stranded DNA-binding protein [candidate division KSB1 bacterium]MDZ7341759.1 single-stranded DNA-binding protein [candidate division KSB1 bacterium]